MRVPPLLLASSIASSIALAPSVALGIPKKSGPPAGGPVSKSPPACGAKILPLVMGNQWTYSPVAAPDPVRPELAKLVPAEPKKIVITVKAIDVGKVDTVVTLEEKITSDLSKDPTKPKLEDKLVTTTITCNKTKFEIAPESFFFAGEPGGDVNVTLDKIDRPKGTSWQLTNGTIGDAGWREELVIKWTRVSTPGSDAKLGGGKLELERAFTVEAPELIITKLGSYHADKLGLVTTGRVTLDQPDAKSTELPANWVSRLWIVDGVGMVQALNTYAHMYQLTDAQLK